MFYISSMFLWVCNVTFAFMVMNATLMGTTIYVKSVPERQNYSSEVAPLQMGVISVCVTVAR
jgi:hypothetical protein